MIFTSYYQNKQVTELYNKSKSRLYQISLGNRFKPNVKKIPELFPENLDYYELDYIELLESRFSYESLKSMIEFLNKENAVLLCHEKDSDLCHRRMFSRFVKYNLGIEIRELDNHIKVDDLNLNTYYSDFIKDWEPLKPIS